MRGNDDIYISTMITLDANFRYRLIYDEISELFELCLMIQDALEKKDTISARSLARRASFNLHRVEKKVGEYSEQAPLQYHKHAKVLHNKWYLVRNALRDLTQERRDRTRHFAFDDSWLELNNPYTVLQISETATKREVQQAYRTLALQHHPDKGGDDNTFKKIQFSYEVLSNDERRNIYDESLRKQRIEGEILRRKQEEREEAERIRKAEEARGEEERIRKAEGDYQRTVEENLRKSKEARQRARARSKHEPISKEQDYWSTLLHSSFGEYYFRPRDTRQLSSETDYFVPGRVFDKTSQPKEFATSYARVKLQTPIGTRGGKLQWRGLNKPSH